MDGAYLTASDELNSRVIAILAAQALREPSGLTAGTTLESLGIDSLGLAEIIFAIEETFDVMVPFNANDPDAETLDLSTVGSVCAAVTALVHDQKG
ncbi:MAG: acyl carrier protein [Rhodobacter sp.]|nr:acyl carrier protein [Paracoccaceae bacterium]MCB1408116.1 acyl carrier protein [Paracoccaceae bacterium]MCC0079007.1 acyl carrier protein [Rhodobacter sp.]